MVAPDAIVVFLGPCGLSLHGKLTLTYALCQPRIHVVCQALQLYSHGSFQFNHFALPRGSQPSPRPFSCVVPSGDFHFTHKLKLSAGDRKSGSPVLRHADGCFRTVARRIKAEPLGRGSKGSHGGYFARHGRTRPMISAKFRASSDT